MPIACSPLWQLLQVCGTTAAWSKRAGTQPLVVWQLPQAAVVAMWLEGLPGAVVPLWQLTQVPTTCE